MKNYIQPVRSRSSNLEFPGTRAKWSIDPLSGIFKKLRGALVFFIIFLSVPCQAPAQAQPDPYSVVFSQKITAFDYQGLAYPVQKIIPAAMPGIQEKVFPLTPGRSLAILTNLGKNRGGDLERIASVVKACYRHVENSTGMELSKDVLLYLIELDKIPFSYEFEAKYSAVSNWGEVRLVLLKKDSPLWGNQGSRELSEFLFDTLPHELGHDVLAKIEPLQHDIDGQPSFHTRWFIEGVCELLAKSFSRREFPPAWERFMELRNIGATFRNPLVRRNIFNWSQENQNTMGLESDLYGASWLLAMSWSEKMPLVRFLQVLDASKTKVDGSRLMALLKRETGLNSDGLLESAVRKELAFLRKSEPIQQPHLQAAIPQKVDIAL